MLFVSFQFPRSSDNKDWWEYVDPTVTKQTLDSKFLVHSFQVPRSEVVQCHSLTR